MQVFRYALLLGALAGYIGFWALFGHAGGLTQGSPLTGGCPGGLVDHPERKLPKPGEGDYDAFAAHLTKAELGA
jgi:hypothetical protein